MHFLVVEGFFCFVSFATGFAIPLISVLFSTFARGAESEPAVRTRFERFRGCIRVGQGCNESSAVHRSQ